MSNGRFDYVKYDDKSLVDQRKAQIAVQEVEAFIDRLPPGRASALAYTKLEECYMWIGKALRDQQIKVNGTAELQESRGPTPPVSTL
jgi:hypothetical protein